MGLDMYLKRYPRYKDTTAEQINAIEALFSYEKRDEKYKEDTLKKYTGIDESNVPSIDAVEFYRKFYRETFSDWDVEHKYGWWRIDEQVGYWRKANAVHKWFVDHVQDGEDDCAYHREVTPEDLIELRDLCIDVVENCPLVYGKVENGMTLVNGKWKTEYVDGKVVMNPEYAEDRLPSESGFFFGGVQYDEWYINDLKETIKICNDVLATTDFENEMVYYVSSW